MVVEAHQNSCTDHRAQFVDRTAERWIEVVCVEFCEWDTCQRIALSGADDLIWTLGSQDISEVEMIVSRLIFARWYRVDVDIDGLASKPLILLKV